MNQRSDDPATQNQRGAATGEDSILAALLDSATEYAIFTADLQGRITTWNEGAARLLGWDELEVLGRPAHVIFTPEDVARGAPEMEMGEALRSGRALDERWHMRKDGERFWGSGLVMPLRMDDEIRGFLKIMRDRTEALRFEQERDRLSRGQARRVGQLKALADAARSVLHAKGLDATLQAITETARSIVGTEQAVVQVTAPNRDGGLAQAVALSSDYAARGGYDPAALAGGGPVQPITGWLAVPLVGHDGGRLGIIHLLDKIDGEFDEADEAILVQLAQFAAVAVENAHTAQALAESEARFRSMADHAPVMIWTTDPTGYCTFINRTWENYTGQRQDDGLGFGWLKMVHPDDQPESERIFLAANRERRPFQLEYRIRRADGVWCWAIDAASPRFAPDGEFLGFTGSVLDISARKLAEDQLRGLNDTLEARVRERTEELLAANRRLQQEIDERAQTAAALRQSQKMEAVGQLTGGIAHDFNNLLTGIVGGLDMLQKRLAAGRPADATRYVELAMNSARRAGTLTHRLLAFARRQALDPQLVDVNALVLSMQDLLVRTTGEHIRLATDLAPDLPMAFTDANQLENALLNLVINARDAMPDGGELTIATGSFVHAPPGWDGPPDMMPEELAPGRYVTMSVTDAGIGMSSEVRASAFDPFFTTKPSGQGSGLGLSMVHGFVRQSGGTVHIESEPGQGTTVRLFLPARDGVVAEAGEAVAEPQRGHGETVLVVEDDQQVRMLVVEMLLDLGYATREAIDGTEALAVLREGDRIDLMITDVGLPGISGRQLAEIARQVRANLRVLLITGYAESIDELGPGVEVMMKPFAVATLAGRVRAMLA